MGCYIMYIFKIILSIFSAILLCKAITENRLKKAYDYLFSSAIMFLLVILVQPVTWVKNSSKSRQQTILIKNKKGCKANLAHRIFVDIAMFYGYKYLTSKTGNVTIMLQQYYIFNFCVIFID